MAASDALPIPRKNVAMRVTFGIFDADGDLVTGATGLDSEVSKDGGSFTDATSEATEIGSTGIYYLDLTSTEMNADTVAVQVKTSTSGAKTTVIVMYPEEAGDVRADVVQISGDSTAADNLEAAADGTGYNLGGGSVVAASVTGAVGSVATGGITAASIAADAIGASELAADAIAEIQSGLALATSTTAAAIRSALGLASANLDTQLDALPTAAENADAIWDELLSGHAVAGSAGHYLTDAGAAADPLMNTVPGSYTSGSAGYALGRIGSGQITTVSRVSQAGNIEELIGGATYSSAAGTSFDWTDADNVWPTLTGATITVSLAHPDGQTASYSGSVVTATGSGKKVRLELTAVQSAALQTLTVGRWSLMVWATLSGGSVVPLVSGYANVIDRPGP